MTIILKPNPKRFDTTNFSISNKPLIRTMPRKFSPNSYRPDQCCQIFFGKIPKNNPIFSSGRSRNFWGVCRNLIMSYKEFNWNFSASVIWSSDHDVKREFFLEIKIVLVVISHIWISRQNWISKCKELGDSRRKFTKGHLSTNQFAIFCTY